MADYSNRQLSKIIVETSDNIESSVSKQRKIANQLEGTFEKFDKKIEELERLHKTEIKLDLSALNSFYEEKDQREYKTSPESLKSA